MKHKILHIDPVTVIHVFVTSRLNYCNPPFLGRKPHTLGSPGREQKSPSHGQPRRLRTHGSAVLPAGLRPLCQNNTVWREPALINIPKDWPLLPVKLPLSPFGWSRQVTEEGLKGGNSSTELAPLTTSNGPTGNSKPTDSWLGLTPPQHLQGSVNWKRFCACQSNSLIHWELPKLLQPLCVRLQTPAVHRPMQRSSKASHYSLVMLLYWKADQALLQTTLSGSPPFLPVGLGVLSWAQ